MLSGKTVLITGGTGSFGKNFIKFLIDRYQLNPLKKLIVFSRDEMKQYIMNQELRQDNLRFFVGDVRDLDRLKKAFKGVDIVIHAAALKIVPTAEYNPFETIMTNVIGSQNVIDAAIDQGVEKVILISTDKAAQPVNLYGSTKLCAEKLFINGNVFSGGKTKFSCVRYGNVIGSRGSIVETLTREPKPKKVYLTDERMSRFWITIDQAIDLVMFALENMTGGEIFIPKIPSMKIVDLFKTLVPEAEREVIGIRPGEKLHEVLLTEEESRHALKFNKYFIVMPDDIEMFDIEGQYKKFLDVGQRLEPGYRFDSNTNDQWISETDLKNLINK